MRKGASKGQNRQRQDRLGNESAIAENLRFALLLPTHSVACIAPYKLPHFKWAPILPTLHSAYSGITFWMFRSHLAPLLYINMTLEKEKLSIN